MKSPAYLEGEDARSEGYNLSHNPYSSGSVESKDWMAGWKHQEAVVVAWRKNVIQSEIDFLDQMEIVQVKSAAFAEQLAEYIRQSSRLTSAQNNRVNKAETARDVKTLQAIRYQLKL